MKFFCANIGFVRSDLQRAAFLWYSYRKMTQALNPAINLIIVFTIEIVNFSKNHNNSAKNRFAYVVRFFIYRKCRGFKQVFKLSLLY